MMIRPFRCRAFIVAYHWASLGYFKATNHPTMQQPKYSPNKSVTKCQKKLHNQNEPQRSTLREAMYIKFGEKCGGKMLKAKHRNYG